VPIPNGHRGLITIAMLGAVTAGGAAALADAPGAPEAAASAPTTSQPRIASQTVPASALRTQLRQLDAEDHALRAALSTARHRLSARVRAEQALLARDEARAAAAAAGVASHQPGTTVTTTLVKTPKQGTHKPAPRVSHPAPKPTPTPTVHTTTRASGGSSGDDGGSDDGSGDD
jgi:hypothetical protein